MKLIKLCLLSAVMFATGTTCVKAQTADEIMEKYQAAIGGKDNLAKIKTIKMTGSMSVQGMDIGITQTIAVDKAMRMDISVMGMNGFTILTKNGGWTYLPFQGGSKVDTMKPEMVKEGQSQLGLKSREFTEYKTAGTKAEYVGKDTMNSVVSYKIKLTDKEGNETMSYFDATTYYLLRTEKKVKTDDQEQEVAVTFANYKKMDEGIVLPMSFSAQGAEFTFKTVEINKPIDENIFKPIIPASDNKSDAPAPKESKPNGEPAPKGKG